MGPKEAKNFVSEIIFNVISEIQEEDKAVTEDEIEKKLSKKAEDYLRASKSEEVA